MKTNDVYTESKRIDDHAHYRVELRTSHYGDTIHLFRCGDGLQQGTSIAIN